MEKKKKEIIKKGKEENIIFMLIGWAGAVSQNPTRCPCMSISSYLQQDDFIKIN